MEKSLHTVVLYYTVYPIEKYFSGWDMVKYKL